MDDVPPPTPPLDPGATGRLGRDAALSLLQRGGDLLASGDFADAGQHFSRVVGFDDPTITAAALLGLGEAHYRLNNEPAAVQAWTAVLQLPETPSTYAAWRNVAAARVRDGDLTGAIAAYREAERRAPQEDKAEIASRLGWLNKETGNARASPALLRAQSRRWSGAHADAPDHRGHQHHLADRALLGPGRRDLRNILALDKIAIAHGEYWRLWSVTLLHADLLHLGFNMYALYIAGTIVERWYGWVRYLLFYLACAAAGSTASFVFGPGNFAVGASGAIFGLFGILLAAGRIHHPVDRESRGLVSRLAFLIVVNLALGFASGGSIDNAAHLGGLAAGLWLGALVPPTGVPTLSTLWRRPVEAGVGAGPTTAPPFVMVLALALVVVVVAAGLAIGTEARTRSRGDAPSVTAVAAHQAPMPRAAGPLVGSTDR